MSSKNNINNKSKIYQKPKSIIEHINEQQETYTVVSKLDIASRNSVYIGFSNKTYTKNANYPNYIHPYDIKNYFNDKDYVTIKLIPIRTDSQLNKLIKEKNIQDLLHGSSSFVKYRDFTDINLRDRN